MLYLFIVEPKEIECSAECVDVLFWEMFCDFDAFETYLIKLIIHPSVDVGYNSVHIG